MSLPLIDKVDNAELVRDQIAAILLTEQAAQQSLAAAAGKDPRLWKLRVFSERSNPWSEFFNTPTDQLDATPIVHVAYDSGNFDPSQSNVVEQQKCNATFHIDCYGHGISADTFGVGHVPGDEKASLEAQRASRLVRNILMAAENTYLQLRGTVTRRWTQSIQMFRPQLDAQSVQQVIGARLSFEVGFNEFSPQVTGQVIESLYLTIKRAETGEVYFVADFPH